MNSDLLQRLRGFLIPQAAVLPSEHFLVARLIGVDFEGFFNSEDFEYDGPYNADFGKLMIRVSSHLLGGDACGLFSYTESTEISLLVKGQYAAEKWSDISEYHDYLVGLAAARMTKLMGEEAFFLCKLYSFSNAELVGGYFNWRQQEVSEKALNYCLGTVMVEQGTAEEEVNGLLTSLSEREKEEILRQHNIDFNEYPAWRRYGSGVTLSNDGNISLNVEMPRDAAFISYLKELLS